MKVSQQISAGKLTSSYISSWNNELQLGFGDDQVTLKMDESELRDLYTRLGERIESIDTERKEEMEAEVAKAKAEAEEAELAVTRLHAEPRGLLRLTTSVEFGSLHLAPALAAFMERDPEIKVELTLADRLIDQSVRFVPAGRAAMQVTDELLRASIEPGAKQFGEEVVIAIPLTAVIEWNNKQIPTIQRL